MPWPRNRRCYPCDVRLRYNGRLLASPLNDPVQPDPPAHHGDVDVHLRGLPAAANDFVLLPDGVFLVVVRTDRCPAVCGNEVYDQWLSETYGNYALSLRAFAQVRPPPEQFHRSILENNISAEGCWYVFTPGASVPNVVLYDDPTNRPSGVLRHPLALKLFACNDPNVPTVTVRRGGTRLLQFVEMGTSASGRDLAEKLRDSRDIRRETLYGIQAVDNSFVRGEVFLQTLAAPDRFPFGWFYKQEVWLLTFGIWLVSCPRIPRTGGRR